MHGPCSTCRQAMWQQQRSASSVRSMSLHAWQSSSLRWGAMEKIVQAVHPVILQDPLMIFRAGGAGRPRWLTLCLMAAYFLPLRFCRP